MIKNNICSADSSASTAAAFGEHSPQRILVVDYNEDIRRLNMEILSNSGYVVDSAEDGDMAWNALRTGGYDLLITGNKMPKMSGLELLKKIRDSHMSLPVIMASGMIPTEAFAQSPSLRPTATLSKPYTVAALLNVVRDVLRVPGAMPAQPARPQWKRSERKHEGRQGAHTLSTVSAQ